MKKKLYKMIFRIHAGGVGLMYPGFSGFYRLDDDLITDPLTFTEGQFTNENVYRLMVEGHIKATIRKHIETYVLGKETAELDASGNIIEDTWKIEPREIEKDKFFMYTIPWYTVEKKEVLA